MAFLRTPDERFADLPGFAYAPQYVLHQGLRAHYLDEGDRNASTTVLCLHGNPTWSYLYRHMIPVFTSAGLRVVAPDLIGFGRSDKPVDPGAHSFEFHRDMLVAFIEALDLNNILLVCQDWGGLLGLTLPMAMPERFTRLLVMNTGLGTGPVSKGFRQWRDYSNNQLDLAVGKVIQRGKPSMTAAEVAAYDAPFPDATYKAALRAFPNMVPDMRLHGVDAPAIVLSRQAASFWRERWKGSSFMAVGMQDPVLGPPVMKALREHINNCPPAFEVAEAGHFLQEWGGPVATAALRHFDLF